MSAAAHRVEAASPEVGVAPLLDVRDLSTEFQKDGTPVRAVDGVSFSLAAGACTAIVGESGAGKSAVARTITGLLPRTGVERHGSALFAGADLMQLDDKQMRRYLGPQIGFLFQDPMSFLNPVIRIGVQLTEHVRAHLGRSKAAANAAAVELLASVGVPDPQRRMRQYPHELSGGTRQRIALAIALACDPALLIADEPTTALDATVQQQVMDLLHEQQVERRMAMLLITHDLRLAASVADEVIVMYAGRIVERGPATAVLNDPRMPYTRALLDAIPQVGPREPLKVIGGEAPDITRLPAGCRFASRCWAATDRCRAQEPPLEDRGPGRESRCWFPEEAGAGRRPASPPLVAAVETAAQPEAADDALVRVEHLSVDYRVPGTKLKLQAVADVSVDVRQGETLAIVGESGCGKSTLAKAILQIAEPTAGEIWLGDVELTRLRGEALRKVRPRIQMVFQDPFSSLNPLRHVGEIVAEPLAIWGRGDAAARRERAREALRAVGLDPDLVERRQPHQLSGGQCQRVAIARAIVLDPELIVCDEPVSALDVSVQAQVLNLLNALKERLGLTMLFISHDLAVVSQVADRVMVMYLGRVCEVGPARQIFEAPAHPYTAALLSSVEAVGAREETHALGDVPSPTDVPSGCRFRRRCPFATDRCAREEPQPRPSGTGTLVACHYPRVFADPDSKEDPS